MGQQLTRDEMIALGLNPYWDYVATMIDAFLAVYPNARYSWAHIALDDNNLDDESIDWCIEQAKRKDLEPEQVLTAEETRATVSMLMLLKSIPEDKRCPA